jgi:hypothetical protein
MINLKVTILRDDFEGDNLLDKANIVLTYNDALLSLMNDVDLLKCYGLMVSVVASLRIKTAASDFAKAKSPYSKQADKILTYVRLSDTTIGFFVSDLGIENFLLRFENQKMYSVNTNDTYLKLVSLFPGLISYVRFDYETFKKDLVSGRIPDLNLDILRQAVGNNFIIETTTTNVDVVSKKATVDTFDWLAAAEAN